MPINKDEAAEVAKLYLSKNPELTYEIMNIQDLDSWIDGHKIVKEKVWVVNCKNLNESYMDGTYFLSIAINLKTGIIEDVISH